MLVEGTFTKIKFSFLSISKLPSNNINCQKGDYVARGWKRQNFIHGKKKSSTL
jgi:hypothetical protein